MREPAQRRNPGRLSTAWEAARKAESGEEGGELAMLLTFLVVLGKESRPGPWRRRRPPIAIEAVRLGTFGHDAHKHVVAVRCADGIVRAVDEVMFGLRYRHERYVTAPLHGDPVNVGASRCRKCREDALCTGSDDSLLAALPRF
jgi:hypothetical protein